MHTIDDQQRRNWSVSSLWSTSVLNVVTSTEKADQAALPSTSSGKIMACGGMLRNLNADVISFSPSRAPGVVGLEKQNYTAALWPHGCRLRMVSIRSRDLSHVVKNREVLHCLYGR